MSEYGMPLDDALWKFPLSAALALLPASMARRGIDLGGPSSTDRVAMAAREKMRNYLHEHFQIV